MTFTVLHASEIISQRLHAQYKLKFQFKLQHNEQTRIGDIQLLILKGQMSVFHFIFSKVTSRVFIPVSDFSFPGIGEWKNVIPGNAGSNPVGRQRTFVSLC